jgi:hypothetical protein
MTTSRFRRADQLRLERLLRRQREIHEEETHIAAATSRVRSQQTGFEPDDAQSPGTTGDLDATRGGVRAVCTRPLE